MPSTLTGLVIFLALLTPGFAYLAKRESRRPSPEYTPLRETAAIATASLVCDALALAVFGVIRTVWPELTPDVGALARGAGNYFETEYLSVGLWATGLLGLASMIALTAAAPPRWLVQRLQRTWLGALVEGADRSPIRHESGWSAAFQHFPDSFVWVTCELVDGTTIGGWLLSANPQVAETNDRSVVLSGPIRIRSSDVTEFSDMDTGTIVISAHQVKFVAVSYFDEAASPPY